MYFSLTPDIIYDTKPVSYPFSESDKTIAKNFFRRYEINPDVYGYATYYNKYAVKEGAKIEDIAEGYYGDVKYDWVIILTNNLINPQFSFPLDDYTVRKIAEEKYGLDGAYSGIHHYETLEYKTPNGVVLLEAGIIVDKNYYDTPHTFNHDVGAVTLPGNQLSKPVTNIEYEYQKNEEKREIYLLRAEYLESFVKDFVEGNRYKESSNYINSRLKESN